MVAPFPGRSTRRKHGKPDARFPTEHHRLLPLFRAGVTWISDPPKYETRMTESNRNKPESIRIRKITPTNSLCTGMTSTVRASSETFQSTGRISTAGLGRISFKGYSIRCRCRCKVSEDDMAALLASEVKFMLNHGIHHASIAHTSAQHFASSTIQQSIQPKVTHHSCDQSLFAKSTAREQIYACDG